MRKNANRNRKLSNTTRKATLGVLEKLEGRTMFAAFTPGDLVVYQSTGSASLTSAATPIVLDEYTTAAGQSAPVNTVALPTTANGSTIPIMTSGNASTQGLITLSGDGTTLLVPGYDTTSGTASITGTTSTVPREVDEVGPLGTVTSQTTLGYQTSSVGTIYGATAANSSGGIYASGSYGIAYATPTGSTATTTLISSVATSTANAAYAVEVINGQLYATFSNNPPLIGPVGSGLPTTTGQAGTTLSGVSFSGTSGSGVGYSREFAFATLNGGTTPDTLYIADNYNDCIDKLSLVGTNWVLTGTIGSYPGNGTPGGALGIVAEPVPTGEQLFFTSKTKVYTAIDTYGYNSSGPAGNTLFNPSPTLQVVATAATNTQFGGIAFVPQSSLTVSPSTPSSETLATGTNTTLFASVAAGTDATVQWQVNTGSGFVNLTNGTDAHGVVVSGVNSNTLSLSNLSLAETGYKYQAVFTSSAAGTATSGATTIVVANVPVVSSVSPAADLPGGGKTITITGQNLTNATVVDFGTVAGTIVSGSNTATSIQVVDPAEAAGNVAVNVTAGGLTSTTSLTTGDTFSYANAPVVSSVAVTYNGSSTATGFDAGGQTATISGTGFIPGSTVTFAGVAATNVTVVSPTTITAVIPAAAYSGGYPADGAVNVQVTTSINTSSSSVTPFTYVPTTVAYAQTLNSGTLVTLGDNPIVTQIVSVGGGAVTNGTAYSNWAFLVTDPSGASAEIYGSLPDSYTPTIGDTLKIAGTFAPSNSIPELDALTMISVVTPSTNTTPPTPAVIPFATANTNPQPVSVAGQLITLDGVYITGEGSSTFGTTNSPTGATISTGANGSGSSMSFYYWPTSYSVASANFDGLAVPSSTTPINITGIVDLYSGNPEFLPIAEPGTIEKFSMTNNASTTDPTTGTASPDGFQYVTRGSTIAVTVTRNETTDASSVGYTEIDDSAVAGIDYTSIAGTLSFAVGQSTASFNVSTATTPGDYGDKIFSIELTNPSAPAGYLPYVTGGLAPIVITDPTTKDAVSENSDNESAMIQPAGPKGTGTGGTFVPTTTTVYVEANNSSNGTSTDYGVLTYNDIGSDPTDVFNTDTYAAIDGLELETVAAPVSYDKSGALNVYLVSDTLTSTYLQSGTNGTGGTGLTGLTFQTTGADSVDGLGSELGTKYLLGTIQYNAAQIPGVYTPYNLTNLDPAGLKILETDLGSGAPFTIAVTPDDSTATATWVGSSGQDLQSPILRVDYSTVATLPVWLASNSDASWNESTQTLTVTGPTKIIGDPAASSDSPIIALTGTAEVLTIASSASTVHIGSLSVAGGASVVMTKQTSPQQVLVDAGTFSIDASSSFDLGNSLLDLKSTSTSTSTSSVLASVTAGTLKSSYTLPGKLGAFGVIVNGTTYGSAGVGIGTFDGANPGTSDVLVRYTYIGDANLDGAVDGSDYTKIDGGFNSAATGWLNGDFNYDGKVDGSDYTLIDNAFNTQGTALTKPSAQIASVFSTAIPASSTAVATSSIADLLDKDKKSTLVSVVDSIGQSTN